MAIKFRKPSSRKQGLKILFYGENGTGKSVSALTFKNIAVIDSESKIGVYESHEVHGKNIIAVADTTSYRDVLELMEEVIKHPDTYNTLLIDSMTKIYSGMQVSLMELEERKAKKKGEEIDNALVSQRGWGKIKLNSERLDNYIAQASANGVTIVVTAWQQNITQEIGGKQVTIGVRPDLRKNAEHVFDVIIRFFKEKDIVTGKYVYKAEVEKDTTGLFQVGSVIENGVHYDMFKEYIESNNKKDVIEANYGNAIKDDIDNGMKEQETHDELVKQFKELYKELVAKDEKNKSKVASLLKEKGVEKYNDSSKTSELKEVIEEMKKM